MELGCDVISEKPMTIDAEKCQQIIDTQKRTGRHLTVTFNYRLRAAQLQGQGDPAVRHRRRHHQRPLEWLLDTNHGADYFRRWHRNKANAAA